MKKYALILSTALLPFSIAALLFIGIETQHREHHTDYSFFIKQQPSLQIFFTNPMVCGECDVEIYEKLPFTRIDEIRTYCKQRFGLNNLRMCHAIFAESQRQAITSSQNIDIITQVAERFINNSNIKDNTNFLYPSVNNKILVPECALPLNVKWRNDADQQRRINVSCENSGRPSEQNSWDINLPIYQN